MTENIRYDGKKLGAILTAQGRKKRWLAHQIGVSESMVNHVISGRRPLSAAIAKRSALVLGLGDAAFFVAAEFQNGKSSLSSRERSA